MNQGIAIRVYSYRHEAELARALLEAQGINGEIVADDCGGMGVGLSFSGGVRVIVDEADAERAHELLAENEG